MRVPWGAPLILSLCVSGCGIKTPHRKIAQWPITSRAMYYHTATPQRVVLLPLADRRPTHERAGQRPTGMFLLLWNRRKGDYYTGDHVFGGDVARALTTQLAAYLQAANVFTEVLHPPFHGEPPHADSHEALAAFGREHAADLVLGGELHHFYGSQFQHTSMYLLPLYFVNTYGWQDQKSLPWGKTSVHVSVYDGRDGDVLWRRLIQANETLPRETDAMSDAALESFATVAGKLATDLRAAQLSGAP